MDREKKQKRRFLRKQREEEDFWDKYKEPYSKFSSNKSFFKEFSLDMTSSKDDNLDGRKIRGDNTCESLGDDDNGGIQLRVKERIFKLAWKDNAGDYFQGIKRCGLSAIKKREK